ncbi:hypothetical protein GLU60_00755 [Nanohaloarchaea archaeon H01]|nr:hypothetical protein [Nanohaloarchaea archaeon H01]
MVRACEQGSRWGTIGWITSRKLSLSGKSKIQRTNTFRLSYLTSILYSKTLLKSEGYGDFSVGISLLDLYSIILVLVPLTAATSYFMISIGLGNVGIDGTIINWLKYFEWAITTPILIAGIAVLTLDKKLTLQAIFIDYMMIVTGFIAVISPMPWKAIMFSISSLLFIGPAYLLFKPFTKKVSERPKVIKRLFTDLRNLILGLWFIYPLIWIPSTEGFGIMTPEQSFAAFATLDMISKLGYAFLVLRNLEKVNEA